MSEHSTATSNRCAGEFTTRRQHFHGHNLFSGDAGEGRFYVVYSYDHHWPLYVYDREEGRWYGNKEKYSSSTSTQMTYARPQSADITMISKADLQSMITERRHQ